MADPEREARFRNIYEGNYARILGYVLRRTDGSEDAADVVAETFLTTWRRLDDVPLGTETRLWLYGVARRALANHHRGRTRRGKLAQRLRWENAQAGAWALPPGRRRAWHVPGGVQGTQA